MESVPIVIDNGSGVCKAGFAGTELPSCVFPSVIGRPLNEPDSEEFYIGKDAFDQRGGLSLKYPIASGKINNWDDMQLIWDHVFKELNVEPHSHPVLLTEAPLNPNFNREKMMQIMFETYRVPFAYLSIQAVLALYATGRTTGLVLDIGDGVTHTVPIYEGYALPHTIRRVDLAGRDLTSYFSTLLTEKGYFFSSSAEMELVREIKESQCYIAQDYEQELQKYEKNPIEMDSEYELPDGMVLNIGSQRFRCPEALFRPELLGREGAGIAQLCADTIKDCDMDIRSHLYRNIVLSGGTTLIDGLGDRLLKDIMNLVPRTLRVKVVTPPQRNFSVWTGGSVLANLPTFETICIAKDDYDEIGKDIVHRKCF
eukprot:TRINITY_DN7790_c0_g2_i1.p1 TRINITY_DN7790_c0_g2~~TRINITY_DN7790_c0_g2_i1.p1  ORF type:complete len:369 (+),score=74.84 TRINITY_DN7790_c0_g2_i1:1-1107(+)